MQSVPAPENLVLCVSVFHQAGLGLMFPVLVEGREVCSLPQNQAAAGEHTRFEISIQHIDPVPAEFVDLPPYKMNAAALVARWMVG